MQAGTRCNPDEARILLSPDGSHVSWLAPLNSVLNVWVAPHEDLEAARPVTHDKGRSISCDLVVDDLKGSTLQVLDEMEQVPGLPEALTSQPKPWALPLEDRTGYRFVFDGLLPAVSGVRIPRCLPRD